jgi:hypothetical protein
MLTRLRQQIAHLARQAILLGLLLTVFGAGFLAVMPEAHECLHAHADQPEHHCWLTQYLDHSVLLLAGVPPQPAPVVVVLLLPARAGEVLPSLAVTESFPPRGPPAAASVLA